MLAVVSLNSCLDRSLEVPCFAVGDHCRARLLAETPAGKGVNVARLLSALHVPALLFGFVGEDAAERFANALADTAIENRLRALPGRTRVNTTILDPVQHVDTHIREQGETVDAYAFALLEEDIRDALQPGDRIVFSGSLPPGINAEAFGGLVARLASGGLRVAVDAADAPLAAALQAGCSLVKPNCEELAGLLALHAIHTDDTVKAVRALMKAHRCTAAAFLVSNGAHGTVLVKNDRAWHAQAERPVAVRNTVGAGDALLSGFLWGLHDGAPEEECLRRAIRVATASLQRVQAGEFDPALLDIPVRVLAL